MAHIAANPATPETSALIPHLPALGLQTPQDMFDQGGFARAVRADQAKDAPAPDLQRNLVKRKGGTELPVQAGDFHDRGCIRWVHLFSLG